MRPLLARSWRHQGGGSVCGDLPVWDGSYRLQNQSSGDLLHSLGNLQTYLCVGLSGKKTNKNKTILTYFFFSHAAKAESDCVALPVHELAGPRRTSGAWRRPQLPHSSQRETGRISRCWTYGHPLQVPPITQSNTLCSSELFSWTPTRCPLGLTTRNALCHTLYKWAYASSLTGSKVLHNQAFNGAINVQWDTESESCTCSWLNYFHTSQQ